MQFMFKNPFKPIEKVTGVSAHEGCIVQSAAKMTSQTMISFVFSHLADTFPNVVNN